MKRAFRLGLLAVLVLALAFLFWPEAKPGPTGGWLKAAGLEPRFATIDGIRVRYVDAGSGPPVILLHGLASSLYTWKDVLPALARGRHVVALDLPGFGQSDQPPDLSFESYPPVVLGLMDRLGIERAALVGNSLGGAVAIVVAAEKPERTERLVLLDAAGQDLAERPLILRLAGWKPVGAAIDGLPVRGRLVRIGLRQVFHDPARITPERFDEYLVPLLRPGATRSIRSLLASPPERPRLVTELATRVKAPTLVVWGREDRWLPVAHADRFAAAIPGARKVVLEACGHLPQEERPEEVVRLLLEFLGS